MPLTAAYGKSHSLHIPRVIECYCSKSVQNIEGLDKCCLTMSHCSRNMIMHCNCLGEEQNSFPRLLTSVSIYDRLLLFFRSTLQTNLTDMLELRM